MLPLGSGVVGSGGPPQWMLACPLSSRFALVEVDIPGGSINGQSDHL